MTGFSKRNKLSFGTEATFIAIVFLMLAARWIIRDSILGDYDNDIILLLITAIAIGLLLYARYRQRRKQQLREEHIQQAIEMEQMKRGRGLQ